MTGGAREGAGEHRSAAPHSGPTGEDTRSDAELLAAHTAGDREAFGELIRRHRGRLWAVSLRMMHQPDDAADALQDACLAAFRSAHRFRGESAVTTWLHRIVVNACLDRLRRMRVRATEPLPEEPDRFRALAVTPDDPGIAAARQRAVAAALLQITLDQRAALILVDIEGYPVAEAAEILGCAPGTVKSRCARGRSRLVQLLRGWQDES